MMRGLTLGLLPLTMAAALLVGTAEVPAESPDSRGVVCRMGGPEGAQRYRPGTWGLVEVNASNPTDEFVEAEAALRFASDSTLQFGRRVAIPPRSNLRTTCPVLVPSNVAPDVNDIAMLTDQIMPRPSAASQLSPHEAMLASQPMILDREVPTVGVIVDLNYKQPVGGPDPTAGGVTELPPSVSQRVFAMVLAAKRARNLSSRISAFDSADLPPDPAGLDILDVLVLGADSLATDPAGTAIVRDWVLAGGQLWIMLDEVRDETVAAVLGNAFTATVVERVRLTEVKIDNARTDLNYQGREVLEFDHPVKFVRVIPGDATVTDTVDGWPAAFWQPFGKGRVFFTTLGASAWVRIGRQPDRRRPDSEWENVPYFAREPLDAFADDCLVRRETPDLDPAALQPYLAQQIGYRILSWRAAAVMLAAFCLVLLVLGLWLFRTGRPERLLWAAPLVAAATSVVFLAIGMATKRAVPPTVATLVRVVYEPGVQTGHAYGLAAMYNQDASQEPVGATRGGLFFPDMSAMSGRNRRIVWTDEGAWRWERLELPPGVRTAPLTRCSPLRETMTCRAQFGPSGLQGSIGPLPLAELDDAIISLPNQPAMAAELTGDGTFTADEGDVLAPGVFISENLLGEQQRRRQAIYAHIIQAPPDTEGRVRPILYAWADAPDLGFVFPQSRQLGSALMSVPVRMEQSPPGTEVAIASPFLPYRAVPDPDGRPPAVFSNLAFTWMETKAAATEWLRFQLPHSVLPIQVRRATLSITARVPSRTLEVLAAGGDQLQVLARFSHPIGTYAAVIERPEHLQLDAAGGLVLAIRVGEEEATEREGELVQAPWKIESLRMQVAGTVGGE